MTWPSGRVRIPRTRFRVVWGFGETMASFCPSRRFSSVDLPTLGRPMRLANPARWSGRDVEGGGGALIQPPEKVHLARVHQPRLERLPVVVAGEVEARVAAQEVELLAERMPQRARLPAGGLDGDDRLADHRRRAGQWERE